MRGTEPQETHAIYLDHDQVGNPRVSITLARRGRRGGGKRIRSLIGRDRDVAYPNLSTILWNHHGKQLGNGSPGPPPGRVPPHQRGRRNPDAAPHGCGEGGVQNGAGPEAGSGHRRHAQLRGQLVVGLPPEPEQTKKGHPGSGIDVRVTRHYERNANLHGSIRFIGCKHALNRSQCEIRRRWETSDEDGSFSRYG